MTKTDAAAAKNGTGGVAKDGGDAAPFGVYHGDDYAGLLIDRLAATIIDDSLPLKEVERDLRGSVAEVAIKKRGLGKRETANRCGVTEKSIENYLKEARNNPKSPEREVARALQDEMLSLEDVYEKISPVLCQTRNFTLDDAKRAIEKLIRTGEVKEYPGHKYRAVERPSIRYPATVDAHRELVDQKARDLDYVVLRQKEATDEDLGRRDQRYSRVIGDSNLVRIDFTVDVGEQELPAFYEKLSAAVAKLTMKEEKKKGKSRVRMLLAMRSVTTILLLALVCFLLPALIRPTTAESQGVRVGNGENARSWELDRQQPQAEDRDEDDPAAGEEDIGGGGGSLERPDDAQVDDVSVGDGDDEEEYRPRPVRGDVNLDAQLDVLDALFVIEYAQFGGELPPCAGAGDIDKNGRLEIWDAFYLLRHLYLGQALDPPVAPVPLT